MITKNLTVGQRDKDHRTFIGWKIRDYITKTTYQELSSDGNWYSVGSPWRDKNELEECASLHGICGTRKLILVWQCESEVRRVLRELVKTLEDQGLVYAGYLKEAKQVLDEK